MSAESKRKWTVEEYLVFERESEYRYEFIDGKIYATRPSNDAARLSPLCKRSTGSCARIE